MTRKRLRPFSLSGWTEGDLRARTFDAVKREIVDWINDGIDNDRQGPITLFTPDGKAYSVRVSSVELKREPEYDGDPEDYIE